MPTHLSSESRNAPSKCFSFTARWTTLFIALLGATARTAHAAAITLPEATFSSFVQFAPPCCVYSPVASTTTGGQPVDSGIIRGEGYAARADALSAVVWTPVASTPALQLAPFVNADASITSSLTTTTIFVPAIAAHASLTYYLSIATPNLGQSTVVPCQALSVTAFGSVTSSGAATSTVEMSIQGTTVGSARAEPGRASDTFNFNGCLQLTTNQIYSVTLTAHTEAVGFRAIGDSVGSALIDPTFSITAPYQSQYQIVFSPNLDAVAGSPVPEPASLTLMVLGGGMLCGQLCKRKRQ